MVRRTRTQLQEKRPRDGASRGIQTHRLLAGLDGAWSLFQGGRYEVHTHKHTHTHTYTHVRSNQNFVLVYMVARLEGNMRVGSAEEGC